MPDPASLPLGQSDSATEVRCEVCEEPTTEPIFDTEEGLNFCGRCAVEMTAAVADSWRDDAKRLANALEMARGFLGMAIRSPNCAAHVADTALTVHRQTVADLKREDDDA